MTLTVRPRIGCLLAAAIGLGACASDPVRDDVTVGTPAGATVEIDRIIDGDSLELTADGVALEVRLLGINAPELRSPDGDPTCAGEEAKNQLADLLDTRPIGLIDEGTDRFGRTLAILTVPTVEGQPDDGATVNELMVRSGWALGLWSADDATLIDMMRSAADARLGWWGDGCGATADELAIGRYQMDPAGDDRQHLDEEWIDLENDATDPVDLSGWVLRDETTTNRFTLDAVTIDPVTIDGGSTVRVHVGDGPSTGSEIYLGHDNPVWSNNGETVLLLRPDGSIAAYEFVDG